jgi:hypothetical protein
MIVIGLLWHSWVIYPLKVLVVFFHELSHGLAAVFTGGSIVRIELTAQEGGACVVAGGNSFIILSAGYIGSLFWGGIILLVATKTGWQKQTTTALGVLILAICVLFVRPLISFGFLFAGILGALLVLIGLKANRDLHQPLLAIIGLTSCMYAIYDISSDILGRPWMRSDAAMLAEITGIPTVVWGVVWISIALVLAGYFLIVANKRYA